MATIDRVILCHGCFDILHVGHILHLQEAAALGSELVVSITADKFITKPGRPVFNQVERAFMLSALECVDKVFICEEKTGVKAILEVKPDVYCKGIDYRNGVIPEEVNACGRVGAEIYYTKTRKYSSSDLVDAICREF